MENLSDLSERCVQRLRVHNNLRCWWEYVCCDDCWNLNLACKQFVRKRRIIKIRLFDRTLICNIAGGLATHA